MNSSFGVKDISKFIKKKSKLEAIVINIPNRYSTPSTASLSTVKEMFHFPFDFLLFPLSFPLFLICAETKERGKDYFLYSLKDSD